MIIPSPDSTKHVRNSSIELYRILAAFAVLIVHFNGWFVGGLPEIFDFNNISLFRSCQVGIQASTCICVNMFILISGYFSIKLKVQSVMRLCLKLLCIFLPFYIVYAIILRSFSVTGLVYNFFVVSRAGYFIQCYMMLMFLSPILNSFVEIYKKRIIAYCLILVLLEFWFGCIMSITLGLEDNLNINRGYSVVHFVAIYLIGRCLFLYQDDLRTIKSYYWIIAYTGCTIVICAMYLLGVRFAFDYSNPVVIISSICSFLPFIYMDFYNNIINWVAGSALSIYIISSGTQIVPLLMKVDEYVLSNYEYCEYLGLIAGLIFVVFSFCVLYDKICGILINPFMRLLLDKSRGLRLTLYM